MKINVNVHLSGIKAEPIRICVCLVIPIMAEEVKANLSLKVCSTFSISFCSLSIRTVICFSYSEYHVNNAVVIMQLVLWKKKTHITWTGISTVCPICTQNYLLSVFKLIACVYIRKWDKNKMICTIFPLMWRDVKALKRIVSLNMSFPCCTYLEDLQREATRVLYKRA